MSNCRAALSAPTASRTATTSCARGTRNPGTSMSLSGSTRRPSPAALNSRAANPRFVIRISRSRSRSSPGCATPAMQTRAPITQGGTSALHDELGVIRRLLPYLWEYRGRVILALAFLVTAKLANIAVPIVMKAIVDGLSPAHAVLAVPFALLAAYGALRLSSTLFNELRDIVFVKVAQRALRRVALQVFHHLHELSLRFHLERQTGGLTRDIERGTRGISTLLSYSVFSVLPTLLEITLVTGFLVYKFDVWFGVITVAAIVIYIGLTFTISEWRTQHRRQMNEMDSKANTRAIDSLLNYETVKYF